MWSRISSRDRSCIAKQPVDNIDAHIRLTRNCWSIRAATQTAAYRRFYLIRAFTKSHYCHNAINDEPLRIFRISLLTWPRSSGARRNGVVRIHPASYLTETAAFEPASGHLWPHHRGAIDEKCTSLNMAPETDCTTCPGCILSPQCRLSLYPLDLKSRSAHQQDRVPYHSPSLVPALPS